MWNNVVCQGTLTELKRIVEEKINNNNWSSNIISKQISQFDLKIIVKFRH